jgi:DNA-binding CsgD family transcriptional regulator/PAS domain-containing protein
MPSGLRLEALIHQAYDCIFENEGWSDLLHSLAQLVGGDSGLVYVKSRNSGAGRLFTSRDFNPSYNVASYLSYYESRSPLIPFYKHQPEGRVRALGRYAFSREYQETEFFQDWIRPQGFADMLGAHLLRTPQHHAWLSVRRPEDRGVYPERELRVADCLAGHLRRVIALSLKLETERNITGNVHAVLDAIGFGVFIVDANERILLANRSAEMILRAADGLKSHRGRLACERAEDDAVLRGGIRAASRSSLPSKSPPVDFAVRRTASHRPLMVHVLPCSSNSAWKALAPSSAIAAVFVIDPLARSPNVNAFATAYGLTAGERRVLHEIVQGDGLVDAASKLGIAVPTARTHLQHVFEKTGVNAQAELVRLLMTSSL